MGPQIRNNRAERSQLKAHLRLWPKPPLRQRKTPQSCRLRALKLNHLSSPSTKMTAVSTLNLAAERPQESRMRRPKRKFKTMEKTRLRSQKMVLRIRPPKRKLAKLRPLRLGKASNTWPISSASKKKKSSKSYLTTLISKTLKLILTPDPA